jgi:hypothetical protein
MSNPTSKLPLKQAAAETSLEYFSMDLASVVRARGAYD